MQLNRRNYAVLFFVLGILATLYVQYSAWRIYWIYQVGFIGLKWHAIAWVYINITLILLLYLSVSNYVFKKYSHAVKMINSGILVGWISICLLEIIARLIGSFNTEPERKHGFYVDPVPNVDLSWFQTSTPNSSKIWTQREFPFSRKTNSLGISDKEWSLRKDSGVIRVLLLGDSFTEGAGTSYDSCYPSRLGRMLNAHYHNTKIEVMNAGICGSDPYFEYKLLECKLLKYHPDIVLYTSGSNDVMHDYLMFGGFERFKPDSTIHFKHISIFFRRLISVSHFSRFLFNIMGYNEESSWATERRYNRRKAYSSSKALSRKYDSLAIANGFYCIQAIRPERDEFEDGVYNILLDSLNTASSLSHHTTVDLLTFYQDSLNIKGNDVLEYYWKEDGHHNAKGYYIMAQGIKSYLIPIISEIEANNKQVQPKSKPMF